MREEEAAAAVAVAPLFLLTMIFLSMYFGEHGVRGEYNENKT